MEKTERNYLALLNEIKVGGLKGDRFENGRFIEPETLDDILKRFNLPFEVDMKRGGGLPISNSITWFKVITPYWELRFPGQSAYDSNGYYNVRVTYVDGRIEIIKIEAHTDFYKATDLYEYIIKAE